MRSLLRIRMHARLERVMQLATEVERWPERLPHYRYVRRLPELTGERHFAMGARRGPIPVRWTAIQRPMPAERRIEFVHTGGLTRGMWVAWRFEPTADGVDVSIEHHLELRWPLVGGFAARRVIGPQFIEAIAGRTLLRIKAIAENEARGRGGDRIVTGRRVVVTGIGAITPIGSGAGGLWAGVMANRSAVRTIDRFDATPFPSRVAGQIDDFDPAAHLDARRARRLDRFSALSVAAARMATEHAGLGTLNGSAARIGVWIGSALGGVAFGEEQHARFVARGVRGVAPTLALAVFGGAGASNVALDLGITGPALGNANSCASGAVAIGQAFAAIRDGTVDAALAGGAEAPLAPLTFGAFALIRVLSQRNDDPAGASRPFDAGRDGFVMGEGAAVLALEERETALRRGAPVIAEILGFGASNDAYHMTAPRPDGREAARAVTLALDDAGVGHGEIGYVNAHASSTPLNELAEARALHVALGAHAARVPVSGTKGLYGHPLGASGAIEAAITALALCHGVLPGTCNLVEPDPDVDLNVLRDAAPIQVERALTTSFGFGGMNAALVLGRARD